MEKSGNRNKKAESKDKLKNGTKSGEKTKKSPNGDTDIGSINSYVPDNTHYNHAQR